MTAISTFSTFTNTTNDQRLEMSNLDNIYMLSDSRLSTLDGEQYVRIDGNHQKIFYLKGSGVVFGLAGVYDIGVKIINGVLEKISVCELINEAPDIHYKINILEKIFLEVLNTFHQNSFKHNTTIVCNTVCNGNFRTIKFWIKKDKREFRRIVITPTEQIGITFDGADGNAFEEFKTQAYENAPENENRSKTYFKSFVSFLESKIPECSGPPCQGVVLNREGRIKELSIRHSDNKFYKMGKEHLDRPFLKQEIDYRDTEFTFLTRSMIT